MLGVGACKQWLRKEKSGERKKPTYREADSCLHASCTLGSVSKFYVGFFLLEKG
jgi:hypothetical protein